jgi:multicomponent Na+:H+ antiporter subunit D
VSDALLISAALLLPLVVSALVGLLGRNPNARDTTMVATGALLLPIVAMLVPRVAAGERPELVLFNMVPGASIAFEVEPLGLVFALVAAALWPVTAMYGVGYLRGHHEDNQTRFFIFFSGAISAAIGVAFAANLVTLFVFYEVLTLSTYPLVTHHQDDEAHRAGRIYLGILLSTSVGLLLLGIVWTWTLAGTTEFRPGGILAGKIDGWPLAALLGLYAYGIGKAGLMPVHRWLPNAMVAPTPVSALLHAVAVVKAGVFSVLKVVVYVFGIELLTSSEMSVWLMYAAAYTMLMGSIVAMTKDNLKERLAYSTIAQLAYIVLGAALASPEGIIGGGMHIAMHAFGKITLFFCAGAIYVAAHKKNISEMDGLGRAMPLTYLAFTIGALSVIGLPPCGGSWSKLYLGLGAAAAGQPLLVGAFMLSSLFNIYYLMDVVFRGVFLDPPEPHHDDHHDGDHHHHEPAEASTLTLVPPLISAAGCIVLFFVQDPIARFLAPLVM